MDRGMPDSNDGLIIECSACQKKLKIPAGSQGRQFRCPGCKTVLSAPAEEAPPAEASPPPDPAGKDEAPPRKKAERRSEGRGRRKAGKGRGRPDREKARSPRPREASAKKSRLPLLLGAAAVLVLGAAAGIAVVLSSGNGEPAESGASEDSGESTEAPAEKKPRKKKKKELSPAEKKRLEEERALLLRGQEALDPGAYIEAGNAAWEKGFKDLARRLWTVAVEKNFPGDIGEGVDVDVIEPVYEKIGYRRYEMPADARPMAKEEGILEFLKAWDGKWLGSETYDWVKRMEGFELRRAREEFDKRKNDPVYAKAQIIKKKLREARGYKDFIFGHHYDEPYLVLDERGKKGEKLADEDDIQFLIEKKIEMLRQVFTFVKKNWMEPLEVERQNHEPMVAVQFKDYRSFVEYNAAVGIRIPPGALAYFNRISTFIFMFDRPASDPEELDKQDGILFHEATHQIVSAFLNKAGMAMMGRVRVSHWFNEGIAEYVGSCTRDEDEEGNRIWIFGQRNPGRAEEFYYALHPKKNKWRRNSGLSKSYAMTLREMARCRMPQQVLMTVIPKLGDLARRNRVQAMSTASSLVYAQASIFLHFCYRGAKKDVYGPCMQKYTAMEFKGKGGWDALQEAFKGHDMAALEREWIAHLEEITPEHVKRGT
jgi:hypothetical protein